MRYDKFTAAQAAQKKMRGIHLQVMVFTAAQAAQQ